MSTPVLVILGGEILAKMGTPAFFPAQGRLQYKFGGLGRETQFQYPLQLPGFICDRQLTGLGLYGGDHLGCTDQPWPVSEYSAVLPKGFTKPGQ